MDSERWKQVNEVLQSALDRAPEERDAFLRSACAGDETLEREVRSLLTSDERAGKFLEAPAICRSQVPVRRIRPASGGLESLPARGPRRIRLKSPQHLHDI